MHCIISNQFFNKSTKHIVYIKVMCSVVSMFLGKFLQRIVDFFVPHKTLIYM